MTNISWTEKTWNPIVGCSIATPGCTNCYAMKMAWRLANTPATPQYHGTVKKVNGHPVWTGKMALAKNVLEHPLNRKKPTMYFVNSMGDLFHEDVPDEWIDKVFAVMALCPQHTFQILTKRAERMREYLNLTNNNWHHPSMDYCALMAATGRYDTPNLDLRNWPLPNIWLGVSCEDQTRADERIPLLLDTPASIRFVSCEPLLGPIDFRFINRHIIPLDDLNMRCATNALNGVIGYTESCCFPEDWPVQKTAKLDLVICGGESGQNARPMHPDWARSLRDQCVASGVPFHFKQWGPKDAGHLLDGREWLQIPEAKP